MKLNKLLMASAILMGSTFAASAQEEVTEYIYTPNWYIQGQFGGQETLGEISFNKLLSPNAQVAVGYNFNPFIGLRLSANGWGSKAAEVFPEQEYRWKWNYVSGNVDVTFNLTNIFGGYRPTRVVDVDLIAGVGCNVGWNNKEAYVQNDLFKARNPLATENLQGFIWNGTKARFMGRFGADINFNVSEHVALGIELTANMLPDTYNSKRADNIDWYFNGLVGVKYTFGKKYKKITRVIEPVPCDPVIVEKVVERIVEVPVEAKEVVEVIPEPFRREVFFTISNTVISDAERFKVEEVANYLKANPKAIVTVTGYADKGTGTMAINLRLSKQRAEAVYNALVKEYGISPDRIRVESMGEAMYQPNNTAQENRVAICVAEEL